MRPKEFDVLLEEVLREMADAEPGASLTAGVMARVEQKRMGQRWAGWGAAAVLASGMLGMVLMYGSHEKEKGTAEGSRVEERAMVGVPIKGNEQLTDLEQAKGVPPSQSESSESSAVPLKARLVRPLRTETDAEPALVEKALEIAPLEVSSLVVKSLARE